MFKQILIGTIHIYQRFISPLLPSSCRYYPTCSQYMIQAIQYRGIFEGFIMGLARILRCHPFVHGGYDPVPDHFSIFKNKSAAKKYRRSMNLR